MILADKIINLRKKNGWSQEELAEKLDVSRQSVSKWEAASSIPDLNRILEMAKIFNVSTDYLLRDEMEDVEVGNYEDSEPESKVRKVSMEEASEFIIVKAETAGGIAKAVALCILSPICLIFLGGASDVHALGISENAACGIGMIILAIMVTVAVAVFIGSGKTTKKFEYLDEEIIETEYGVTGMVKEKQKAFRNTYTNHNIIGACCCILSIIPIFIGAIFEAKTLLLVGMVCALLALVSVGVYFFVSAGIVEASYEKLLQEGDYSKAKKKRNKNSESFSTAYWMIIVAIFLGYSFITKDWENSWIVWPVAGVSYAAVKIIWSSLRKKDEE